MIRVGIADDNVISTWLAAGRYEDIVQLHIHYEIPEDSSTSKDAGTLLTYHDWLALRAYIDGIFAENRDDDDG
jgi:hypothetical protein